MNRRSFLTVLTGAIACIAKSANLQIASPQAEAGCGFACRNSDSPKLKKLVAKLHMPTRAETDKAIREFSRIMQHMDSKPGLGEMLRAGRGVGEV